jgi:hypothetical protein
LFVPARQIESVQKFDRDQNPVVPPFLLTNSNFVAPERISNVLELL